MTPRQKHKTRAKAGGRKKFLEVIAASASTPPLTGPIEHGDRAKDAITGFTGIVICISKWINGCIRVVIQGENLEFKKGVEDSVSVDLQQVVLLAKDPLGLAPKTGAPAPGGPFPDAEMGMNTPN